MDEAHLGEEVVVGWVSLEDVMLKLSVDHVLKFLSRFDRTAQPLAARGRRAFQLKDEADVRDMVYAALKPLIDDLQREPPIENFASLGSRPDLASDELGLVIEIKTTLKGSRKEKDLLRECTDRVFRYGTYPPLRDLVFFVYDPDHLIKDRDNVARDFTADCKKGEKAFRTHMVGPGFPPPIPHESQTDGRAQGLRKPATDEATALARLKPKLVELTKDNRMFWLGHSLTIEYAALDSELALQPGMTKALVRSAVAGAGFQLDEFGEESASIKPHPPQFTVPGAKRRW